jgi:hypothetical protein
VTHTSGECALSRSVQDVCDERDRQVEKEGWSQEHDDEHTRRELSTAAGCYLLYTESYPEEGHPPPEWPWDPEWWKPRDFRRDLVRAGALVLAEIDRVDRSAS